MRNKFFLSLAAVIVLFSVSHAEIKVYQKTVKKVVGTTQSADDAKTFAVADAKRAIIEEAGTYIQSYTRVENGALEKDQIEAIATGLLSTEVADVQNLIENGAYVISVTVKASVNSDTLKSDIDRIRNNEKLMSDYAFVQNKLKEQLDANKALEEKAKKLEMELKTSKDEAQKQLIEQQQTALKENNAKSANLVNATFYFNQAFDITGKEKASYDDKRKALSYLNKAIELNTQYDDAYFFRGNFYEMVDQTDKAISDYKTALSFNPANYKAINALSLIYFNVKNDHNTAIKLLSDTIDKDPFAKEPYGYRSSLYLMDGQAEPALRDAQTVVKLDPSDAEAMMTLATMYDLRQDTQNAIDTYTAVIALDPKNVYAYRSRASLYTVMGETDKALKDITTAISAAPADEQNYMARGDIYSKLEKNDLALKDYNKAIEVAKSKAYAYSARASFYIKTEKYDLALKDYAQAIALEPSDRFNYISRANLYIDLHEYKKALEDYDKVIKINPGSYEYSIRASAYEKMGEYQQALGDYSSAIEKSKDDYYLYYHRGLVYVNLGSHRQAIDNFTTAIKLSPTSDYLYSERAKQYDDIQEYDNAIADYSKTIQISPSDINAYYSRGWIYYVQMNYDNALKDFNRCIELDGKYAEAYKARAVVYEGFAGKNNLSDYDRSDYLDKANSDYNAAIFINNSDTNAYSSRAANNYLKMYYKNAANKREAQAANRKFVPLGDESILKDLAIVQKLNDKDLRPYLFRARYYVTMEQYQAAVNEYTAAIKLNPDYGNTYTDRAEVYGMMNKTDLMCADAEKACKLGTCWQIESYKKYGNCK